jgi:hypothetical protein
MATKEYEASNPLSDEVLPSPLPPPYIRGPTEHPSQAPEHVEEIKETAPPAYFTPQPTSQLITTIQPSPQQFRPITQVVTNPPSLQHHVRQMPSDYLALSVFTLLCCCCPIGICAVASSLEVFPSFRMPKLAICT